MRDRRADRSPAHRLCAAAATWHICAIVGLLGTATLQAAPKSLSVPQQLTRAELRRVALTSTDDPVAVQLVTDMLKSQRNLAYVGEQVTTIYSTSRPAQTSQQTITRDGLRGMRMEYHSPDQLAGEIRGDNGRVLWHYIPSKDQIEQLPSAISQLRIEINRAFAALRKGSIGVRTVGEDVVAGKKAVVVQAAAADGTGAGSRRFWIDPVNGAQLRIVVYRPDGNPVSDSYFTQINYVSALPRTTFDPPGDKVQAHGTGERPFKSVKQLPAGIVPQLGFDPLEPTYIPAGFQFVTGQMFQYKGSPALGIKYGNGLTVMSLYEAPAKAQDQGNRFKINRPGMLTGVISGLQIVLLANVDSQELIRVYQSLR